MNQTYSKKKPSILMVSPVECYPTHFGNSARIAALLDYLSEKEYEVLYLHLPERPFDPELMKRNLGARYIYRPFKRSYLTQFRLKLRTFIAFLERKDHCEIRIDDLLAPSDIGLFNRIFKQYRPDIVYIHYSYLSKLLRYVPKGVRKILDTHDSLHLRFKQLYSTGSSLSKKRITVEDEIQALNRADVVIAIQHKEQLFFKEHGCTAELAVVGHPIPFRKGALRTCRRNLLYIAANYSLNIESIRFFLDHIWGEVEKNGLPWQLYIAGSIGEEIRAFTDVYTQVNIVGVVQDLAALYEEIDVTINPVQRGSGLKIKNMESLSFGKPVVTTSVGAEGLEEFEERGLIAVDDPAAWLKMLDQLLSDDTYYQCQVDAIPLALESYNRRNWQVFESILTE